MIGCGNPDAGDDAAGLLAVEEARPALEALPGVEVVGHASPLELVHLLEGVGAVVVVDAIRTTGGARAPGELVRVESGPDGLPAEIRSALSSHGLGVAEAVGLAAAIGLEPRVVVVGVEAGEAGEATAGGSLSEPVAWAVPRLAAEVVGAVTALLRPKAPRGGADRPPPRGGPRTTMSPRGSGGPS